MGGPCSRTSLGSPVTSEPRADPQQAFKAILSETTSHSAVWSKGLSFPQGVSELAFHQAKFTPQATDLFSGNVVAPPSLPHICYSPGDSCGIQTYST